MLFSPAVLAPWVFIACFGQGYASASVDGSYGGSYGSYGEQECGGGMRYFSIDAHVTHGVNTYNNETVVDFSGVSAAWGSFPALPEAGVFNAAPNATNSLDITADTPLDSVMANLDTTVLNAVFGIERGSGPFNLPFGEVETLTIDAAFGDESRVSPTPFADGPDASGFWGLHTSETADLPTTLAKWNSAAGRLSGFCDDQGGAEVTIELQNALPNGLYTFWDNGVIDPLMPTETLSIGPLGGLPNVIVTDRFGYGQQTRKLMFCPFDKCSDVPERCTVFVSVIYHSDHQVYGGGPSIGGGPTAGQVFSSYLQWNTDGEAKIPVQNPFM